MVFNSLQFIFLFFPLVLLGLAFLPRQGGSSGAIAFLLVASLVFYGFSGARGVAVLLLSLAFNYAAARAIGADAFGPRRLWFWLGVLGNLLLLGAFKYARLLPGNALELGRLASAGSGWNVPLGLSFYTLTQIGYLVDVYSGHGAERHAGRYALSVAGFPHVSAGPILRYEDMRPQFSALRLGTIPAERLAAGLTLIAIGLFKKVSLAAGMESLARPVFDGAALGAHLAWWEGVVGSVAYSFQLYFDFSGYSDIAVGLAGICGLTLPWNFNSPYKAVSIVDFWDRWHMSLSRWLQTFLFTPLMLSLSRMAGATRLLGLSTLTWAYAAATIVTMLLCGVWHGVGVTFIVWGLMHGVLLAVHRVWREVKRPPGGRRVWMLRAVTFAAVTLAWVPFRSPTMTAAANLWWALIGGNGGFVPGSAPGVLRGLSPAYLAGWMLAGMVVVWGLPSTKEWMERTPADRRRGSAFSEVLCLSGWRPNVRMALAVSVLFLYAILSLQGKSEFIYLGF